MELVCWRDTSWGSKGTRSAAKAKKDPPGQPQAEWGAIQIFVNTSVLVSQTLLEMGIFIASKRILHVVQTFSSVPFALAWLSEKKHLAFFQYSDSLINVSSGNNTPAWWRQPYWTQTLNLKQQLWHKLQAHQRCHCHLLLCSGGTKPPPITASASFVPWAVLNMALGKMTKSENCFQILEASFSIPLNKDDRPLQAMYITWEPDIYRHFSHSTLVEQLENK